MKRYLWFAWLVVVWLVPAQAAQGFNAVAAHGCDFNGDDFDDQALSARYEDLDSISGAMEDAGGVNVIFGSAAGGTYVGNKFWSQDTPGVTTGVAEPRDGFGGALACGNFNGDAYDDLAIGVAGEDIGVDSAGVVHILPGSATGLSATGDQLWHQNIRYIAGGADPGDQFGSALAAGDFDGDGFDDLAIGVPGEEEDPSIPNSGGVNVIRGSSSLLTAVGDQFWSQATGGTRDEINPYDGFGSVLAAGDFDGDGFDDLTVGIPGENTKNLLGQRVDNGGAVQILPGSSGLLTATGDQWLTQETPAVPDKSEPFDNFGAALAVGDFDGGNDDLAVGLPGERVGADTNVQAGAVIVLRGISGLPDYLLAEVGSEIWSQDSLTIAEGPGRFDSFGAALASGYFNSDVYADLAVGVPGEDVGPIPIVGAGGVNVIQGASGELLTDVGNKFWSQSTADVEDVSENGDAFGASLATGDLNGDILDDLVIAAPLENIGLIFDACQVNTLFGTPPHGLEVDGNRVWNQNSLGIEDQVEPSDCAQIIT